MPRHYYKGIVLELRPGVYEPREDSELLAAAIEREIGSRAGPTALDVGCGSGIIAIVAAKAGAKTTAVDVSEEAVELTGENARRNRVTIDCRQSDLFSNVSGRFDIIAFNAPYLPEAVAPGDNEAWAAGRQLEVIRRAIGQAKEHLNAGGALLLVVSSLSGAGRVGQILEARGYGWQVAAEKKVPWEVLYVLRATL